MQNLIFFKLVCSLLPDAFILCFSGPKSKNSDFLFEPGGDFLAAITQHAIVEKRAGEGMFFFPFFFPLLMFWLELKAYGDAPHVL